MANTTCLEIAGSVTNDHVFLEQMMLLILASSYSVAYAWFYNIANQSVAYACLYNLAHESVAYACFYNLAHQSGAYTCLYNLVHQSVADVCFYNLVHQSVAYACFYNLIHQSFAYQNQHFVCTFVRFCTKAVWCKRGLKIAPSQSFAQIMIFYMFTLARNRQLAP